jgi:hypothetical protein
MLPLSISALVSQFEQEIVPKERWTHEAHVAVGLYYVLHYGKEEALSKIRTNIRKYNLTAGNQLGLARLS